VGRVVGGEHVDLGMPSHEPAKAVLVGDALEFVGGHDGLEQPDACVKTRPMFDLAVGPVTTPSICADSTQSIPRFHGGVTGPTHATSRYRLLTH
jgi:hypothetical protein